tara:strand:+ start:206 stop:541 length:336 start_codon:yes stop_codon:yes gene_type:complete
VYICITISHKAHNLKLENFETILIKTNGTVLIDFKANDLPDYQKAVKGLIQKVNLIDESYLYVNEKGWTLDLPQNKIASNLTMHNIYGDVLLFIKNKKSMYYDLVLDSIML